VRPVPGERPSLPWTSPIAERLVRATGLEPAPPCFAVPARVEREARLSAAAEISGCSLLKRLGSPARECSSRSVFLFRHTRMRGLVGGCDGGAFVYLFMPAPSSLAVSMLCWSLQLHDEAVGVGIDLFQGVELDAAKTGHGRRQERLGAVDAHRVLVQRDGSHGMPRTFLKYSTASFWCTGAKCWSVEKPLRCSTVSLAPFSVRWACRNFHSQS